MTTFNKLVALINSSHDEITRKKIMGSNIGGTITLDNYRNLLTQAGYLRIKTPGVYFILKNINTELSSWDIRREAYPT